MQLIIGLFAFVIMLSLIVLIHEAGHFLAAKKFGVYVHEFSIGMGPALYQKKGKETTFSIRAIPFGGYVMMAGETDGSQDEEEEDSWLKEVPQDRRLNNKATWKQVVVMAAGVVMNVILAAFLFVGIAVARGYVIESEPVISQVVENSPAERAGFQPGDRILKMESNGETMVPKSQTDVTMFVNLYPGETTFTMDRNGETVELVATPEKDEEEGVYLIGYISQAKAVKGNFFQLVKAGLDDMAYNGSLIFRSFGMLAKGKGYDQLSGPIGILDVTTQTAQLGLLAYLSLFAMISLNIGIFNLIPIPALDGGRIVILLLEKALGRKVNTKLVENVIMASFILLFGLLIYASYNDIIRMFF